MVATTRFYPRLLEATATLVEFSCKSCWLEATVGRMSWIIVKTTNQYWLFLPAATLQLLLAKDMKRFTQTGRSGSFRKIKREIVLNKKKATTSTAK